MKKRNRKISLINQIMIATVLGVLCGFLFQGAVSDLKIVGELFLRLIQMSVVVLIMGAVIEAVGGLEAKELGKIGLKVFLWFMGSTILAAIIGILFGLLFKPGVGLTTAALQEEVVGMADASLQEIILGFIPLNIIEAMAEANMIQVIIFSLLFGLALSLIKEEKTNQLILEWIIAFNNVILKMVTLIMKAAPIGIFCLIASVVGEAGIQVLGTLVRFLVTLGIASLIFLVIWLLITAWYCKVGVFRLVKNMWRMSVISFTTTSSAVSLPVQIEDSREKLGISDRISKLVVPLGMSLNSNGLAMFLSLSVITFTQFYNVELSVGKLIQIVLLSTLACLGTIVVPGGGLVALATVMPMLGLPTESIALLAGIDWFSGMFRTLLNVDADVTVAMIIACDENELDYAIFNGEKRFSDDAKEFKIGDI
ncbi:dicarboxylate/amino acid:cation symporter [Enterococcus sp. BWB1-3]|uniref:dicarboxylate/amino acid:cation symporter n=1 Tax=unclassified Enterococcus TaxID=2608891 RepID=UPI00192096C1|nr:MULTISPECIES: dicarboxylate/amino acid:cation symporter [unclassified Enterococcus]MBL1228397.1 dicarboxylate/amino acid:cation symporter [Enterococcus sp. BWB1-3]MCB5951212.1 dicarboxylate/amino acid:cation symporter [Enterococcus sp. BWT-B8]MCB5954843.1 dicarboxylate/amino acid:cation symporter [Enterococcus sp. CWB-B31]